MYKQAAQMKLRVATTRGTLSVEQLYDLPVGELDTLAVFLEKAYNNSKEKSFIVKKTSKNKVLKLQFDIVLDILQTKLELEDSARELKENKEHNQKILTLIAEKQDESLKGKSIAELTQMLK